MKRRFVIAAAFALAASSTAMADTNGGNWPAIAAADEAGPEDLARMAADFPNSGITLRRIAGANFESDPAAAADAVERFTEIGGALSEAGQQQVSALFAPDRWARVAARMAANAAPLVNSESFAEVPPNLGLIEGIAFVPFGDNIIVSSVTGRSLHLLTDGRWQPYAADERAPGDIPMAMESPLGIVFDATTGRLWVASSVVDQTPNAGLGLSGLIGIPSDGGPSEWYAAPAGAQPGDVALGPDGSVYLSDGAQGAVYVHQPDATGLDRLIEPGRLHSAQGMAVSPDGGALIVADYSYGLARYDFATGALDQLTSDLPVMLDGIDALMEYDGDLIAIRNGSAPHAILRIRIDPAARQILAVEPLERAHPDWGEPTLGAIAGDTLIYIADARWGDFGEGGAPADGAEPRPTHIRTLDLSRMASQVGNMADSSR